LNEAVNKGGEGEYIKNPPKSDVVKNRTFDNRLFLIGLGLFCIGAVADITTTIVGLQAGYAEFNPIVIVGIEHMGYGFLIYSRMLAALIVSIPYRKDIRTVAFGLGLMGILWSAIGLWNASVLGWI